MSFLETTQEIYQDKIAISFRDTQITYSEFDNSVEDLTKKINLLTKEKCLIANYFRRDVRELSVTLATIKSSHVGLNISDDCSVDYLIKVIKKNPINFLLSDQDLSKEFTKESIQFTKIIFDSFYCYHLSNHSFENDNLFQLAKWSLLTSGSTGEAKIVLISKENLIERVSREIEIFQINDKDNIAIFLNLSHDLGLNQFLTAYQSKATIYLHKYIFFQDFYNLLLHNKITGFTAIAFFWKEFLKNSNYFDFKKLNLRFTTISGSRLTRTEELAILPLLPENIQIFKTYGQTETFRSLICTISSHPFQGYCYPNVFLRLDSAKNYHHGELIHRGAGTMLGYLGDTDLKNEIHTGDIFKFHPDGGYEFEGRSDSLIKIKGIRISVNEVEDELVKEFNLNSCYILCNLNDTDIAVLFIEGKELCQNEKRAIISHLKTKINSSALPQDFFTLSTFPLLHSRKINRLEIKNYYEKLRFNK